MSARWIWDDSEATIWGIFNSINFINFFAYLEQDIIKLNYLQQHVAN